MSTITVYHVPYFRKLSDSHSQNFYSVQLNVCIALLVFFVRLRFTLSPSLEANTVVNSKIITIATTKISLIKKFILFPPNIWL